MSLRRRRGDRFLGISPPQGRRIHRLAVRVPVAVGLHLHAAARPCQEPWALRRCLCLARSPETVTNTVLVYVLVERIRVHRSGGERGDKGEFAIVRANSLEDSVWITCPHLPTRPRCLPGTAVPIHAQVNTPPELSPAHPPSVPGYPQPFPRQAQVIPSACPLIHISTGLCVQGARFVSLLHAPFLAVAGCARQ